jgi:hypothetical protein
MCEDSRQSTRVGVRIYDKAAAAADTTICLLFVPLIVFHHNVRGHASPAHASAARCAGLDLSKAVLTKTSYFLVSFDKLGNSVKSL